MSPDDRRDFIPQCLIIIALILLALLALKLRLTNLNQKSLWFDEGFSFALVDVPLNQVPRLCAQALHPPLYFVILKLWVMLDDSVSWARLLSVLLGIISVPLVYLLAKRFMTWQAALATCLLFALSPFHIHYSQEIRMYSLFCLLALLTGYLAFIYAERQSWLTGAGFSLCSALLLYCHYYGVYFLLAMFGFISYRLLVIINPDKSLWKVTLPGLVTFILFLPWLDNFFFHIQCGTLGQFLARPLPGLVEIFNILVHFLFGYTPSVMVFSPYTSLSLLIVFILLFLILVVQAGLTKEAEKPTLFRYFLVWFIVIPVLVILLSLQLRARFYDRYLIFLLPFVLVAIGRGLFQIRHRVLTVICALVIFILFLTSSAGELKLDIRDVTLPAFDWINKRAPRQDIFIHTSIWSFFPFRYYDRDKVRNRLLLTDGEKIYTHLLTLQEGEVIKPTFLSSHQVNQVWLIISCWTPAPVATCSQEAEVQWLKRGWIILNGKDFSFYVKKIRVLLLKSEL